VLSELDCVVDSTTTSMHTALDNVAPLKKKLIGQKRLTLSLFCLLWCLFWFLSPRWGGAGSRKSGAESGQLLLRHLSFICTHQGFLLRTYRSNQISPDCLTSHCGNPALTCALSAKRYPWFAYPASLCLRSSSLSFPCGFRDFTFHADAAIILQPRLPAVPTCLLAPPGFRKR